MLDTYRQHVAERAAQGIPPRPLDAGQVAALVELLKEPPADAQEQLLEMIRERVPPGVDEAAYVKAAFLADIARDDVQSPLLDPAQATELLGTMLGGYNIEPLIALLDSESLAPIAARALSHTLLLFDAFHDVREKAEAGSTHAEQVMQSWADGEWFTQRPAPADIITATVFKVTGETNTDDLSPAQDAWSRPDIPLHALAMLKMAREGLTPDRPGEIGPITLIEKLKKQGHPLAYVGDVVGTGSSRKSATNSVLWHMGQDLPCIPNKRGSGLCLGGKIAPIFFNTMEDAGALPIECDVQDMAMGDVIDIHLGAGRITSQGSDRTLCEFTLKTPILLAEVQAGGRIPLIIGRALTERARETLGLGPSELFQQDQTRTSSGRRRRGYTLAQKVVGRACGLEGVRPGSYCEPRMSTVGSQDTTGPMTRDELKDLACLGFSADLVMQSFCHTAAYPKPVDIETQHSLPDFIRTRGGVSLRPGDGIIHSWLNRMLLPDQVGTGGDSHTRFPLGVSFPAGSGLVAFAAATGVMPLDMPESVLVRFRGKLQPGVTLRDLVNAIPYAALQSGDLTLDKKGKKNIFSGRILEIEGLPHLKCEQAFEFSDASAERSSNGCTIRLDKAPIIEYLQSNVVLLRWMISQGYGDARTLERRAASMEEWLKDPQLLAPDADAEYMKIFDIDLDTIREPLLACPNDPDDIRPLSEVAGTSIDEVFIGSCMTNIGHFRAAGRILEQCSGTLPTRLWLSPPTRMDQHQLTEEGYYSIFGQIGARAEMPGCSLCMGNQARVAAGASVVSTSTRNFPNRLGDGANVFLASAEVAAVAAILGRIPNREEYLGFARDLDALAANVYRYLNFDEIESFQEQAALARSRLEAIPVAVQSP